MSTSSKGWLLAAIRPSRIELRRARRVLHVKSAMTLALATMSYWLLVFASIPPWARVLAGVVLSQALVAIATGIMHDGNHGAFSSKRWLNRLAALSADVLGASSLLWRRQHNDRHHRHTNIVGLDGDLDQQPFARLAPWQPHRRHHSWQHLYMWPLYGFLAIKWFVIGDLRTLVASRRQGRARDWLWVTLGKMTHLTWAIIIPSLVYSPLLVLYAYLAISWVVGFTLAVLFQLAHCVDNAEFLDSDVSHTKGDDAVLHQLATTVDFESTNPLVRSYMSFLCGGLEYQVEHHLMPRMPHTLYPQLARRLRELCTSHELEHRDHRSVRAAVSAHQRHLRAMGTRDGTRHLVGTK